MIGRVLPHDGKVQAYKSKTDFKSYFGEIRKGDLLLDVQLLDPINPGGNVFRAVPPSFPIFVEDIRVGKLKMKYQSVKESKKPFPKPVLTHSDEEELDDDIPLIDMQKGPKFELSSDDKANILKLITDL